jgi:type III pantothenate kinase
MRFLADLGNARLKLAQIDAVGRVARRAVLETDRQETWPDRLAELGGLDHTAEWGIASVRPAAAESLVEMLQNAPVARVWLFCSAAETGVRHRLVHPGSTGADRACAVRGWCMRQPVQKGGAVVLCGTALTVERIEPGGLWVGGAIAAGWRPLTEALHHRTAQLPLIELAEGPHVAPYGGETRSALEAGLRAMLVGGCREMLAGIRADLPPDAVTLWTGGDAAWLAPAVDGPAAVCLVEPDLILHGLAATLGWSR